MKTKIISLLLVAIMMLSYAPIAQTAHLNPYLIKANAVEAVQTGTCGDNLQWTLSAETGELIITGTGDTITSSTFSKNTTIKSVVFPDSIKEIGTNAFNSCTSLEKIEFCEPLKNDLVIKSSAFQNCYSLKEINLPEKLSVIEGNAFSYCPTLESIHIPSSVTELGNFCFFNCGALETVTFAENSKLKNLGDSSNFGPFYSCYSLKNIVLPDSVKVIGFGTFGICLSLEYINIPKNVIDIAGLFADNPGGNGAIPSLKTISVDPENKNFFLDKNGSLCGNNKYAPELLAVPNRINSETLTITKNSNSYSHNYSYNMQFYRYVTNIKEIVVEEGVFGYTVVDGVLYNADKTELLKYPSDKKDEEFMIPASVTSIFPYAFFGADNLKSFTVEEGNTAFVAEDGVLYDSQKQEIINYPLGKDSKEFKIGSTVEEINTIPFLFAKNIESFSVEEGNEYFSSDQNGILYRVKDMTTLFLYPNKKETKEFTISRDVYGVNASAFYNSNVEVINIPETVRGRGFSSSCPLFKKFKCINYEGESFFGEIPNATRIASSTVNNSIKDRDSTTRIEYSYVNGCFNYNGDIDFEVVEKPKEDCEDSFKGYANECQDIFFYQIKFYALDENHNRTEEIQPISGKKIKIGFPIPDKYKRYDSSSFIVLHKRSDNGKMEFFIPQKENIEITKNYIYIWTDNFSPFALVVDENWSSKIVSSISITSPPVKTSYTYKKDNLDLSGMALNVTYFDGKTEAITDIAKINISSALDNTKVGTQAIIVEYQGATTDFEVTVSYTWWQWLIRIFLLGIFWY